MTSKSAFTCVLRFIACSMAAIPQFGPSSRCTTGGPAPGVRPRDRAEPDGRAVGQAEFLSTLAGTLDARRVEGEFDPYPARLVHDKMDLRSLARELRGEFHNNSRPTGSAFVQGIKRRSIGDCEGEMMKADVGAPVERDRFVRRLDPP
jgi:hypothetical protein